MNGVILCYNFNNSYTTINQNIICAKYHLYLNFKKSSMS